MKEDLILRKNFNLYDNQLDLGEILGRLCIHHEIFPAPAIFWEFETYNNFERVRDFFVHPIDQESIYIPKLSIGKPYDENSRIAFRKGNFISGSAAKVILGDRNLKSNSFSFYLPNAKFQSLEMAGHNFIVKEINFKYAKSQAKFGSKEREGYLNLLISDSYEITLYTPSRAITWLNSFRSIGTNITTEGTLKILKNEISIFEAEDILYDISYLLSFMNGGDITPLVIKMEPSTFTKNFPVICTANATDPIEKLSATWLGRKSDSRELLLCLESFRKMLKSNQWKENLDLILIWYFQAIQFSDIRQDGKPWPIVANVLGAALEKLALIILVEEK